MGISKRAARLIAALAAAALLACGCTANNSASSVTPSSEPPASSRPEQSAPEASNEPQVLDLKVAVLKGPSAIGMLPLMERAGQDDESLINNYSFTMAGAPDQLVGSVISGELDLAVLPTNLAATVYNKTKGGVRLVTINTLGVLYLAEAGDGITGIADLKGKTVYSSGQGSTPEYALDFVLRGNGLIPGEDVTVEYRAEHSEITALLASGEAQYAVLPQPFLQAALAQNDKLRVALDLTEEWEKVAGDGGSLAMSGIVVRTELLESNPEAIAAFLAEYKASTEQVNDPQQLDTVADLAVKYEIIPKKPIAQAAIPQCNIVFLEGAEMQKAAGSFLQVLFEANPQSVGGTLPDESFYYIP